VSIEGELLAELRRLDRPNTGGTGAELLSRYHGFADVELGLSEEFIERQDAPDALDILTRPIGETRTTGWVICPSLGRDQANLRRLEAMAARKLASLGYPVLRLREGERSPQADHGFSVRMDVARRAVERLVDRTGVSRVGLIGALFGGTVAAMVAADLRLPLLVLWQPVVQGREYLRDAFRLETVWGLAGTADRRTTTGSASKRAFEELQATGRTVVRGMELTAERYTAISGVDLAREVDDFAGLALVVSISADGEPSTAHRGLVERLSRHGDATLTAIADPLVVPFGEHYYRDEGLMRVDTRLDLDRRVVQATAEWIASQDDRRPT
jgi:hypothetical protein